MLQFPFAADQARQFQWMYAQKHHLAMLLHLPLAMQIPLEFMLIPPGEFQMGSAEEGPIHHVSIAKPFYLGKTAVTQAQWMALMGANPAYFKGNEQLPMETVTWEECDQFCQALSRHSGFPARLPSEAEWEYACRAGSNALYSFGESQDMLPLHGWYRDNSDNCSHPVTQKIPNGWGLYDMHGGIDEYCQDLWHANYEGAPADGSAWINGGEQKYRVLRGGSWYDLAQYCSSGHRNYYDAQKPSEDHGFRVAISVVDALTP